MKTITIIRNVIMLFALILSLCACSNDVDVVFPLPQLPELFISSSADGTTVNFSQTIFDGGSNGLINTFNAQDLITTLQTYKNGLDNSDGFWTIRMVNIDIEDISLPYTLQNDQATISWIDESVKNLQQPCSAPDVICFYSGIGTNEITLTITSVENNIIKGVFSGRLYHYQFNPTFTKDLNDFIDISEGQFSILYNALP